MEILTTYTIQVGLTTITICKQYKVTSTTQNYPPTRVHDLYSQRTSRLTLVLSELSEYLSHYLPYSALKCFQVIFAAVILLAQLAKILTHYTHTEKYNKRIDSNSSVWKVVEFSTCASSYWKIQIFLQQSNLRFFRLASSSLCSTSFFLYSSSALARLSCTPSGCCVVAILHMVEFDVSVHVVARAAVT